MNAPDRVVHTAAQNIPLAFIAPSATNPRKRFDETQLNELTESVRRHGVLQPILVRSGSSSKDPRILWELVAGERRYRAAKAAGLEEIPAVVRSLTDIEALELQVVENLQRADLHPLEEAEGYEQLLKLQAYAADDLAAKVGKSRAYVYARLKLCALTPKAREAFYAGKLNPSTALLVARIPVPALQERALKEITDENRYGGAMSVRDCMRHLQEHYMLRLADAPFPTADEKLTRAGSCAACPKRTGNAADLFNDVKSADVCTDPECFDQKKSAHVIRLRTAAEAKGQKVISGKEAKKLISYDTHIDKASGYIGLDESNYDDAKNRTYRQLLGNKCPTPTLIETARGTFVEAVAMKDVSEHLKVKAPGASNDYAAQQRQREAKAKLETSIRGSIFRAIGDQHPGTMTPVDAALIAVALWDRTDHDVAKRILQIWEPEATAKAKEHAIYDLRRTFAKRIASMVVPDLCRLMVQCSIGNEVYAGGHSNSKPERLVATAERLGVDHAAIRSELTKAGKAKVQAKKQTGAKKAKKSAKASAA